MGYVSRNIVGSISSIRLVLFITNSEVKIYALEKDENSFEALGKLS